MSDALAGLRLGGGEHAVLAAEDDPAAYSAFVGGDEANVGRITSLSDRTKVGQRDFAWFAEIWEVVRT
jgi:hypothetical protein